MSNSYTFDGSIQIEPPLNFKEIKKAREVAMGILREGWDKKRATPESVFEGHMPLKPEITEQPMDNDEGTQILRRAADLIPSHPCEGSMSYGMDTLVEALVKALPGHNWGGEVVAVDENRTSAYKLVVDVHKGKSRIEQVSGSAYIKWDNDSKDTPLSLIL